jgi:hypothetical protein
MQEWTASNAEVILRELGRRLELIKQLQALVHTATEVEEVLAQPEQQDYLAHNEATVRSPN